MQKKSCQYQNYGKGKIDKHEISKYKHQIMLEKVTSIVTLIANKL